MGYGNSSNYGSTGFGNVNADNKGKTVLPQKDKVNPKTVDFMNKIKAKLKEKLAK